MVINPLQEVVKRELRLVAMQTSADTLDISLEVSQKLEIELTHDLAVSPKGPHILLQRHLNTHVHQYSSHNS